MRHRNRGNGRDLVQATVDDEGSRADTDAGCEAETGDDVTPDRYPNDNAVPPDGHIDELDEALGATPEDVEDTADVPG